jgi:hypothetical protein
MIDYQWKGNLVNFYNLVASCYLSSFFLIAVASVLLNENLSYKMIQTGELEAGYNYARSCKIRFALILSNFVLLLISLSTYEIS